MNQSEKILQLLRERGDRGASNFELMEIAFQYPARVHHLRHKEGHVIESVHVKDKEWRITLVKDADVVLNTISKAKRPVNEEEIASHLALPINTITSRINELLSLNRVELAFKAVYPKTGEEVPYWKPLCESA